MSSYTQDQPRQKVVEGIQEPLGKCWRSVTCKCGRSAKSLGEPCGNVHKLNHNPMVSFVGGREKDTSPADLATFSVKFRNCYT